MGESPMCARCRIQRRASAGTGALCGDCEDAIEDMTQAELDADYEAHTRPDPRTTQPEENHD